MSGKYLYKKALSKGRLQSTNKKVADSIEKVKYYNKPQQNIIKSNPKNPPKVL